MMASRMVKISECNNQDDQADPNIKVENITDT